MPVVVPLCWTDRRLVDLGLCRSRYGQALQVGARWMGHMMNPGGWD